jgi:hypothetical protein
MAIIEIARIQVRRGQENTTGIPQLQPGEFGWAEDTQHLYIGKRITEGAYNDNNSRVLTEVDLPGILEGLRNSTTATQNTLYQYRSFTNTNYIRTHSHVRLLQDKLDETVSVYDFMTGSPSTTTNVTPTDITIELNDAIQTLFNNPGNLYDARRALKIPAGNFVMSQMIDLPPNTVLIGEGKGLTRLILSATSNKSMFRTVDKFGSNFDGSMSSLTTSSSKDILISDMTISYARGNTNVSPLILLDNTQDVRIHNVGFTTIDANLASPTLVSTGTAIAIRGNLGNDESSFVCRNVSISECSFENVKRAIDIYGKVTGPIIENSIFYNLQEGINLSPINGFTTPPINTTVHNNKFRFVIRPAIRIETSTYVTNLISSDNTYHYVGNGNATPDDNLNAAASPVLLFNAPGNTSVNDFFNRKVVKDSYDGTDYYNPLVKGNSRINNSSVYVKEIRSSVLNQNVVRIPLTGSDQVAYIDYQLVNIDMSRKGRLTLNISADGYASVSDYYNYSELVADSSYQLLFSTGLDQASLNNFITLTCSNASSTATTRLEYSLDLMV